MSAFRETADLIAKNSYESITALFKLEPTFLTVQTPLGTWLHYAARFGKLDAVRCLVELGADLNANSRDGGNALQDAAANGHIAVVKYLFANGSQLDVSRPEYSPLLSAIYNRHLEVVEFLVDAGIDVHIVYRSENGRLKNALSHAIQYGSADIVSFLKAKDCRLPIEGVDIAINESKVSFPLRSRLRLGTSSSGMRAGSKHAQNEPVLRSS